jgi:hypothetical protein
MIMKSTLLFLGLALTPILASAEPLDVSCSMNTTCQFGIQGQFNKRVHSGDIEGGKIYICRVSSKTEGYHFNIQNVKASSGITFTAGERFDTPFIIDALETVGRGEVHYTLHNNDKVWRHDIIQYKCMAEN